METNITGEDLLSKEPEYFSKLVLGNFMSHIKSVKKSRWIFFTLAFYYRFVKYWFPLPLTVNGSYKGILLFLLFLQWSHSRKWWDQISDTLFIFDR